MNFFAFGLPAFASFSSLACAGTDGKLYGLYGPQVPGVCIGVGLLSADMGRPHGRALGPSDALSSTCDHRVWKTGLKYG